ncbi:hypothetical protein AXF42_Ash016707 [Apostasia shenzhenica]|uniref:INO80 complex subunit B-like conserved region domain-containing protein n=1 Tax=Apostasia shenzhenica TaxID=1088818 RepID=A0A2I0AQ27_9ASPA|nr:hypothetical protein AXF42_Ash016707 [Apostasia shenzhenica]
MEGEGGFRTTQAAASVFKRKRSSSVRRPRQGSPLRFGSRDPSPLSSTQSSDNTDKLSPDYSSDHDGGSGSSRRKEIFLNNPPTRVASLSKFDDVAVSRKNKRDRVAEIDVHYASSSSRDQGRNGSDMKRCSEGVLAPINSKNFNKEYFEMKLLSPERCEHNLHQSAGTSNTLVESKLKKVKLKVGGVTRTIHAKSNVETRTIGSSSLRPSHSSEGSRPRQKMICQDDSGDNRSPQEKGSGSLGDLWNDVTIVNSSRNKLDDGDLSGRQRDQQLGVSSVEPIRKSRRVPKRRVLDGEFDDGEVDDELRYIGRLKTSKTIADCIAENEKDDDDRSKKRKFAKVTKNRSISYVVDEDYQLSRMSKDAKDNRKKSRLGRLSDDTDYVEEEEPLSDDDNEEKKKRPKKLPADSSPDVRSEPLTTRQRAMQPGKDGNGLSLIEFPHGLPPAPTRKQKQKLSEVEEQAKKAEAAQRRKMQVEKAARESEAAAIRKILGLDSDKKKAEKEKAQAEKAKAANSQISEGNYIKWIMGPNGTTVTFPEDVGLPSLFASNPCSYPPQREKCAGPSCVNPYKYRDSKSNLPLCSLQCYKAVQGIVT